MEPVMNVSRKVESTSIIWASITFLFNNLLRIVADLWFLLQVGRWQIFLALQLIVQSSVPIKILLRRGVYKAHIIIRITRVLFTAIILEALCLRHPARLLELKSKVRIWPNIF